MGRLSSVFDATRNVERKLRAALSHQRQLAFTRTLLRAAALGRSLHWERERGCVVVYDAERAIRLRSERTENVWEVVNFLSELHATVDPSEPWTGPDQRVRPLVDVSQRRAHVLCRSRRELVFSFIPESDDDNLLYLELAQLQPGDVVIDCGAYCGASTCAFAEAVGPSGRVIAFEPDDANWSALTENVARHCPENVVVEKLGIWSEDTTLHFIESGNMGSRIAEVARNEVGVRSIETTTLASVVRAHRLERLDFIKMDIEGAEVRVLEASAPLLRQLSPRIVVEAHHLDDGQLATQRLQTFFASVGYMSIIVLPHARSPHQLLYAYPQRTRTREGRPPPPRAAESVKGASARWT